MTPAFQIVSLPSDVNRLFLGDCLAVMRTLPAASVDLIYVDPPFFTRRDHDGFDDTWKTGISEYLRWLKVRLGAMRRLLKPTGSLFVHLDWHAGHYVKVALDRIFGYGNFRNEIVWHYGSGGRARTVFPRKHDVILWYSRSQKWIFNREAVAVPRDRCRACGSQRPKWNNLRRCVDPNGRVFRTIKSAGKIYRYYDDEPTLPADVWLGINHLQQKDPERLGYPTQKPEALLERIVLAASRENDVVADFFCGSGTTLAVAQNLGRRWLGCDSSPKAVAVAGKRLRQILNEPRPSGSDSRHSAP